ncbi:MAG: VCBS repeat-containing protein [Minicystis sp.]
MRDLLWDNVGTNRFVVWLLDGSRLLASGPEISGPPGSGWDTCFGTDFNGDEMADVLWSNPTTNQFAVWLMNGTHVLARGPEIPGPPGTGWLLATAGEFNHDGLPDIVWHNPTTNQLAVWLLNGTHVLAPGPEIPSPGEGWRVVPCGDFNGDGMTDVIWSDPRTKEFTVWLMNGTQVLARGPVIAGPPGDGWNLVPSGDANGDGMSDVFWDNPTTNRFAVWLMNGAQLLAPGPELPGPVD